MKTYSSMDLIKMLQADGWYFYKANGSHFHFKHPMKHGKVTVPHPRKNIPIKTAKSIFQQAEIKT